MSAVLVTSLSWHAGDRPILDEVDLELRGGELVALAGPNGAGKSTLLRLIAGELAPTHGEIHIAGRPLGTLGASEQALLRAVMPQHTTLQFGFTVRQLATMGRHPHAAGGDDDGIVVGAMSDADVLHLADRSFPTLSGGEQSLATLARVLAQRTGILLLDEPTAALDIRHRAHVMSVARAVADDGAAVCVVAHDVNLAAAYADRIALLAEGRKVADGPPWETLTSERIEAVFGQPATVIRSPVGDHPVVIPHPVAGHAAGVRA